MIYEYITDIYSCHCDSINGFQVVMKVFTTSIIPFDDELFISVYSFTHFYLFSEFLREVIDLKEKKIEIFFFNIISVWIANHRNVSFLYGY